MVTDIQRLVDQLDELIAAYAALIQKSQYDDASDLPGESRVLMNRLESAIERITMPSSVYRRQLELHKDQETFIKLPEFGGIAEALRDDLKAGWSESVVEQVHADMYSSYLDMAAALLENGFKDPAAVIAGTSLEVHVRELCEKNAVDVEVNGKPKRADTMNTDLKKVGVYGTLQQKQVTAWMDLRNKAAHGNYHEYGHAEVGAFIRGVREFMLKYPA
ncbi:hypothetical protein ACFYM5_35710 [Streptomyces sp. NPDC006706]|uniref:hypothetical protein n=1 Tax=Streptomyces sp. NPDC006706 TaxID=3364761 RepID=UPI0036B37583